MVGFALNVDDERKFCRAITKQVQRSDARIEVDRMHTRWRNSAESSARGCITVQGLVKYAQEGRNTGTSQVCTRGKEYRD
jgi:hypothetical protein